MTTSTTPESTTNAWSDVYFCYFYSNLSYTCQTQCQLNGRQLLTGDVPGDEGLKYFYYECRENVTIPPEQRWDLNQHSMSYIDSLKLFVTPFLE